MISELRHACNQAGCKVRETGSCLEGVDPEECTHHTFVSVEQLAEPVPDAQVGGDEGDDTGAGDTVVPMRDLHRGEALTLSDASVVSVSGPSKLIVLAGDQEAGKTTLITTLYEKFLTAPFCDCRFAGSLTLPGFEERAFDARVDSGRERASTQHTSVSDGLRVLHLCLEPKERAERRHLLFGDLSGELYRLCRESTADAQELQFLRRTDYLCLLVDGERLADPRERLGEIGGAEGTLRSLLEAEMLGSESRIDVVCSKWDLVHGDEAAVRFVDEKLEEVRAVFEGDVGELKLGRIAARPERITETVPHGFGLEVLLKRWMSPQPRLAHIEYELPEVQSNERECARFARRYPMEGRGEF